MKFINGRVGEIDFSPLQEVFEDGGESWWTAHHDD